jgi:ClpP class serine protease
MASETRAYAPRGVVAIDPSAFGLEWLLQAQAEPFTVVGKAAIVDICGPLTHRKTPEAWFQTYSEITCSVRAASEASGTDTILLKINSPGGDVHGAFDCAREIRAIADSAGKKLIAYSESTACSAAYAIACAADEFAISDTACVGSIGVIAMLVDTTVLDGALGMRFTTVTSGARKADGNPHVKTTDGAVEAMQVVVDAMAAVFFDHVAARRGMSVEAVAALQAGVFVGAAAVTNQLANSVESFSSLLGRIENPPLVSSEQITMPDDDKKDEKKEDATRASLVTAAQSDDEDKAARAKRALAAYDSDESDDDKKDEKDDKKEAAAVAAALGPVAKQFSAEKADLSKQLAAQQADIAALKAKADASDRALIFAARKDIGAEMIKALEATPTSALQAVVDQIPTATGFVNPKMVEAKPTQGATGAHTLSANPELDHKMGLVQAQTVTENVGSLQRFGVKSFVSAGGTK